MKSIVLDVRSLDDTLADTVRAMRTGRDAHIGFATPELLCVEYPFDAVKVEFLLQAA